MNTIRNHIQGRFTIIPNGLIEDVSLSDRSRFLYIVLAQKPPDWKFFTKQLCKSLGMHPDTFRKYRDELCVSGWIYVEDQQIGKGEFKTRIYHLNSEPLTDNIDESIRDLKEQKERIFPTRKKSDTEKNGLGKTPTLNNTNIQQERKKSKKNNKYLKKAKNSNFQNPNPR